MHGSSPRKVSKAVAEYRKSNGPPFVNQARLPGLNCIPGTKIVAQSPPGCIVQEGAGPQRRKPCLFDFDVMQEYIIPRKAFFNRFVAVNEPDGKYTVLGLPVAIAHPKYQRNEFIFNFGLVVVRLLPQPQSQSQSPAPDPALSRSHKAQDRDHDHDEDEDTRLGTPALTPSDQNKHAVGERCRPDPLREGCSAAGGHVRRDGEAE